MSACDFCNAPHPEWFYPASRFAMEHLGWGSRGGWVACDACSQLIESGEDHKLARRALLHSPDLAIVAAGLSRQERRYLEDEVMQTHRRFRRHRSGPRQGLG